VVGRSVSVASRQSHAKKMAMAAGWPPFVARWSRSR
jgi:hypothetical protein